MLAHPAKRWHGLLVRKDTLLVAASQLGKGLFAESVLACSQTV